MMDEDPIVTSPSPNNNTLNDSVDGDQNVVKVINKCDSFDDDCNKTIKINGLNNNNNNNGDVASCRVSVQNSFDGDCVKSEVMNGDSVSTPSSGAVNNSEHKYVSIIDINSTFDSVMECTDTYNGSDSVDFIRAEGYSNTESPGYPSPGCEADPNVSIIDVRPATVAPDSGGGGEPNYRTEDANAPETHAVHNGNVIENGDVDDCDDSSCCDDVHERSLREKLKRTRSGSSDYWNGEEADDTCIVEFLDKSTDGAEARLAAKRQARAEAREIRMRELERQQKEAEENSDKVYDIYSTPDALNRSSRVAASVASPRSSSVLSGGGNNSYHSSRRSSEDSLEEATSLRDMRHELKEVEDKFRKAMIANAQLDNEKAAAAYQVELFKDRLEELDEQHSQLQREHREKCRQFEALKRATAKLQEDLEFTRAQLEERDRLIEEQGLVIVGSEYSSSEEDNSDTDRRKTKKTPKRALVSMQVAEVLDKVGEGSLDVRLKKFLEHHNELLDELNRVKLELEEERSRGRGNRSATLNGPSDDLEDIQREANKLLGDYKFKLQKADQDVSTLQANVARLESQVVRYKTAAETAERVEDDLKVEKRKLQRELRESQARVEELETAHSHLQKRLDKLKNAKSALLKDL